jgi:hypothetical protein
MNKAIYRAIDHIVIRLPEADGISALFGETFRLPTTWPLQQSNFATFSWVSLGNTNLEFWAATDNSDLPADAQPPLIHGFALDPESLTSSIKLLSELKTHCKPPRSFQTDDGQGGLVTNFTNSVLLDVSTDACLIFFCEWNENGNIFPWREKLSSTDRRARECEAWRQSGGGKLGIIGLSEIQLKVADFDAMMTRWETITASTGNPLALTNDIALRLLPGERDQIESLVLAVKCLETAKHFLSENALLGEVGLKSVQISPEACHGLSFKLVQAEFN